MAKHISSKAPLKLKNNFGYSAHSISLLFFKQLQGIKISHLYRLIIIHNSSTILKKRKTILTNLTILYICINFYLFLDKELL